MSVFIGGTAGGRAAVGKSPPTHQGDLSALTVRELVALCSERGIATSPKARKAEIIAAIEANDGGAS